MFSSLPAFSASNFLAAFLNLLPNGRAWAKYANSNLTTAVATLQPTYERNVEQANALVNDIFPAQTVQLLPEWEASLGLPDPCAGEAPTIALRRQQVVARFIAGGGQSIPYIIQYAADLGYRISITEEHAFLMGLSDMGEDAITDTYAPFSWYVHAPVYSAWLFKMGVNAMGDALGGFNNDVLECEIRRIAPAHTIPVFMYFNSIDMPSVSMATNSGAVKLATTTPIPAASLLITGTGTIGHS